MTTTTPPPATTENSPLALLFAIAATTGTPPAGDGRHDTETPLTEEEQRKDAEIAALDHVLNVYPRTLAQALNENAWHGWAAAPLSGLAPSATTYLDDGLWLHHRSTGLCWGGDVLALVAPCTCGGGYVYRVLDGEDDLLQILTGLRATGGHFPHDQAQPNCANICGS